MIDVSELIIDPDFAQPYMVHRMSGDFVAGRFVEIPTTLQFYGVVIAANVKDVNMMPEGDRIAGLMVFYTTADNPIFVTRNLDNNKGTSDQIEWRGELYRIMQTYPYNDYGFIKAIGTRMVGD